VVAEQPGDVQPLRQQREGLGIGRGKTRGGAMETVAEEHHALRAMSTEQAAEAVQRLGAVVGGDELAAGGEVMALFQMQVRDGHELARRPDEGAARAEHEALTGDVEGGEGGHDNRMGE